MRPRAIVFNLLALEAAHVAEAHRLPLCAVAAFAPRYGPPDGFWPALADAQPRLAAALGYSDITDGWSAAGESTGRSETQPSTPPAGALARERPSGAQTQGQPATSRRGVTSQPPVVDCALVSAWLWRLFLDDQGDLRERLGLPPCPFTDADETPVLPLVAPRLFLSLAPVWAAAGLPGLQSLPAAATLTGTWHCPCPPSAIRSSATSRALAQVAAWRRVYPAARVVLVCFGSMEALGLLTPAHAQRIVTALTALTLQNGHWVVLLQAQPTGPLAQACAARVLTAGGSAAASAIARKLGATMKEGAITEKGTTATPRATTKEGPMATQGAPTSTTVSTTIPAAATNTTAAAPSTPGTAMPGAAMTEERGRFAVVCGALAHEALMATVDVVVHHGGAGTVAAAAAAGVAQLACPFHFDQV